MTFFQCMSLGVLAVFMGILLFVTISSYSRPSGSTGQNMAQIQQLRYATQQKQ